MRLQSYKTRLRLEAEKVKGKDAAEAFGTAEDQWQAGLGEIENNLKNDAQKVAFRQAGLNRSKSFDRSLQVHVAKERQAWDNGSNSRSFKRFKRQRNFKL